MLRAFARVARPAIRLAAARPGLLVLARANQQATADSNLFAADDKLRRSLLYRSKQRGWLEMDIMLGNWASANLHKLDTAQLHQFEQLLKLEDGQIRFFGMTMVIIGLLLFWFVS
jgi:succinate dehydrogenase assembly factor 2